MVDIFREDDNDKSDDEDERIEFSTNKEAIERQRMKDNFLAAEHGECFTFLSQMEFPTSINWTSPLTFSGLLGSIFHFIQI